MTRFEYVTFELADFVDAPALRYQKIMLDYEHGKDIPEFAFLADLKAEMETEYDKADLEPTEEAQLEYWVRKLAKLMAVDMLTSGKTSSENMAMAVALPDEAFDRCIALCNEMASELNIRVKENEARYKSKNHSVDNVL